MKPETLISRLHRTAKRVSDSLPPAVTPQARQTAIAGLEMAAEAVRPFVGPAGAALADAEMTDMSLLMMGEK
jgi:hypothetical protein